MILKSRTQFFEVLDPSLIDACHYLGPPWQSICGWQCTSTDPWIIPGYHHYVLRTSMYHLWMSTLPGAPLSKYPWMTMWQCTSMDYPWISSLQQTCTAVIHVSPVDFHISCDPLVKAVECTSIKNSCIYSSVASTLSKY